ncbi:MAG TPA: 30S ribosomal protein S17e [Candidatus Saccharimonadales bacterium]|nr:30S ribosomal protein S17e [Candidatus Saccharimonadales bacterium]
MNYSITRKRDKIPLFFSYSVDRVKKMANELLERYPDKFTSDFNENKETIKNFAVVRSKELRNKIAGYITSNVNRNLAQQNASLSYSEDSPEPREEIIE